MINFKKHIIKKVKKSTPFCKAGKIILDRKLKNVFKKINTFLTTDSIENLHDMRISIRRFRYVMEIFYQCYNKNLFKEVYGKAKYLQDLVGEGRDLDVITHKISGIINELNLSLPESFSEKMEAEKIKVRQLIKIELVKFIENKNVNKFLLKSK